MFWKTLICLLIIIITGCSNTPRNLLVEDILWLGPFDDANYIWHKDGRLISFVNYSWSNDGQQIAFVQQGYIWTATIDGKMKNRVTFNKGKHPICSPSNNRILYVSDGNIWIKDLISFKDIQLTTDGKSLEASWSPDGKTILFVRDKNIWVINDDGLAQKQLTTGEDSWQPFYSPDGNKIAFNSFRGGNKDNIWIMKPDGSELYKLPKQGSNIKWSPDSSKIICLSGDTGGNYLAFFIMDVNTKKVIKAMNILKSIPQSNWSSAIIGDNDYYEQTFSWSPDGSRIAFDNKVNGKNNIFVMDNEGENLCQLTTIGNAKKPLWSPNGNKIMFKSENNIGILVLGE